MRRVIWMLLPLAAAFGSDRGIPLHRSFDLQDYGGDPQIWSLAEDDRGVIYAGDNSGISEYDGVSWRRIATPHTTVIRSMVKGPGGRIYVGETGLFGYLQPDQTGKMVFRSLLDFVPKEDRDFGEIFRVYATPEVVYFQARDRLFRLTKNGQGWRTRSWKPVKSFRYSFFVYNTLYVGDAEGNLQRLNGDQLEQVPLPDHGHSGGSVVSTMLPAGPPGSGQILLGTYDGHLFLMDADTVRPFAVDSSPAAHGTRSSYSAVTLSDGAFGIGTYNGFLILERDGREREYLGREADIKATGILSALVDHNGTLWLGTQGGIERFEVASPFSELGELSGLVSRPISLAKFRGRLYVGTPNGAFFLNPETGEFKIVPGTKNLVAIGLLAHKDRLLLTAGADGVFEWNGDTLRPILKGSNGNAYHFAAASKQNEDRVWLATRDGLASIRQDSSGRWIDEGLVVPAPGTVQVVESPPGTLWLTTRTRGMDRVQFQGTSLQSPAVERDFGKAHGLEGRILPVSVKGHMIFNSPKTGAREFDPAKGGFFQSEFSRMFTPEVGTPFEDKDGNIWLDTNPPTYLVRQSDGSFKADGSRLRRIAAAKLENWFQDDEGVLWLGATAPARIFRFDPAMGNVHESFSTLVRRATAGDKEKRTLYEGAGAPQKLSEILYRNNAMRLEFAATSLDVPQKNEFQSKLEGFDPDWSDWSTETRRDYTNLPPGDYRFRVRSKDILWQEGGEADYRFKILPPWYRTWWAYGLYVLLLAGAIYAAGRLMRRRLIARERTASEAKALQTELERKRNVEQLSEIGKDLTASLDIDTIFGKLYESVNKLVDASIFGVGIYHAQANSIEYRLAFDNGKRFQPYRRDTLDKNQFPVWCIDNRKPVFVNDVASEYSRYIERYDEPGNKLEDGSASEAAQSLIYLPLIAKDQVLGIITVQSPRKNAYTEYQLNLLENLAAYTSIALDNADAYQRLKSAQEQLVVQQKLASLGALTAGIAHEIKNPLNFVNNFADLSVDLMRELSEDLEKQKGLIPAKDFENMESLIGDLTGNAKKINEHGKRADGIVRSMLLHSRGQAGERQPTDINSMLDEYINLAYHGMRAQDSSFNITIERSFGNDVGKVDAVAQDLSRVFLNVLNNACYAAYDKAKQSSNGFAPTLCVRTLNLGDAVEVRIRDNGFGIPQEVRDKIFNPFFTTKPTGQGTGLGLSISHDIVVQEHGGQLEVETESGRYTEFVVRLPRRWRKAA